MKKLRLFALFMVLSVSLSAAPSDMSLDEATGRLEELALEVKDPQTQKLIQDALKSALLVLRKGSAAGTDMANKALIKVQKVIAMVHARAMNSAFHNKHVNKHHLSSSSSSSACDVCAEVSDVASAVEECCEDITARIRQIISTIESDAQCDAPLVIDTVPVTLSESGKYCVTQDLVYDGTGAAITVMANDVTINFHSHSLTLTNEAAEGVRVQDVREFTLENDIIQGDSVYQTNTSAAVHLVNVHKATLTDLYTKNTTKGIWLEGSTDVSLNRCLLENHEGQPYDSPVQSRLVGVTNGAALWISSSNGVCINDSSFRALDLSEFDSTRSSTAVVIDNSSKNISFADSNFYDWLGTLYAPSLDGLLMDRCQTVANRFSRLQFAQFGSCGEDGDASNIIIRNSIFKKESPQTSFFEGIVLVLGSSCLLENVILDAQIVADEYMFTLFHIGVPQCGQYRDVVAKNCVFKGAALDAIRMDAANGVLIEDSQITMPTGWGIEIFEPSVGCFVNNCVINSHSGVRIFTENTTNGIRNCQVYGAPNDSGINVTGPNNVTNNTVYGNNIGIITSSGPEEVYFNTSCNNFSNNCVSVPTGQVPNAPAYAGTTICCQDGNSG